MFQSISSPCSSLALCFGGFFPSKGEAEGHVTCEKFRRSKQLFACFGIATSFKMPPQKKVSGHKKIKIQATSAVSPEAAALVSDYAEAKLGDGECEQKAAACFRESKRIDQPRLAKTYWIVF